MKSLKSFLSRRRRVKKVCDGCCGGLPQQGNAKNDAFQIKMKDFI